MAKAQRKMDAKLKARQEAWEAAREGRRGGAVTHKVQNTMQKAPGSRSVRKS
jgi:hypothetical protein